MRHRPFYLVAGAWFSSRSNTDRMNPLAVYPYRRKASSLALSGLGTWINSRTIFMEPHPVPRVYHIYHLIVH